MSQKTLVLDIETGPIVAYVWGLRDEYVPLNHIKSDWQVLAWSAKWLGDAPSKMMYRDQRRAKDIQNDSAILKDLWKLLDEADIVITQNGQSFDARKLNARFMLLGMKPPRPYRHFDTYRLVSRVASFTSNKLEYLTAKLNKKYKKLSHSKFPGMELWKQCLAGNKKAWDEMKRYNVHDTLATEELYLNIRAWAPETFPKVHQLTDGSSHCGTCGYKGQMIEGKPRQAQRYAYRQHSCPKCGAWQTGTRIKGELK